MTRQVLDVRNLLCPLPVIRTQHAVAQLKPGDTLEICASDPGALHDIPTWCRINGHGVLSASRSGLDVRITVMVKET
jgi:tRNA 2-thiouridine synthesizing protein A